MSPDTVAQPTGLATAREVAKYLRTSTNQLSRLRYEGYGPKFVKLGRSVRYRWTDVDAWVAVNVHTTSAGGAE
ncbi:hypothetical protein A5668_01380 [Mycolicibacterium fortuitum]|uniref:helix-turn-helix transcriptional regulator n=1 Tax=Mycolicibacterium fortuitum TaxID=1766 RepID=UPI0007EC2C7C|nr:helix-turn-helix domain-containing protein [Mycolicibacterium fortuitum]OBB07092.1 hypothetical protein A5668_01380 [Mycolicibacterium fortuitum]SKV50235.1 Helix-turn-helix domain [Mycobacteroides abscessus subsp. abscessus]